MSATPRTYRIYCFDGTNMTVSGDLIEAANDAEATAAVQSRGFGSKCEIWEGDRLVCQLDGERRQA